MGPSTSTSAVRPLLLVLFFVAVDAQWDPTSRDFTAVCIRMGELGKDFCESFNLCCSEEHKLNKLNGDKCQVADRNNGCEGDGVGGFQRASCRAFNCTAEITTTTTTTLSPDVANSAATAGIFSGMILLLCSALFLSQAASIRSLSKVFV